MSMTHQTAPAGQALSRRDAQGPSPRAAYRRALAWAFTMFSSLRMVAYLPTIWAIYSHGDASQHSLLTWLTWVGANTTMAAWLYEEHGQRFSRAMAVNVGNAIMCIVVSTLIAVFR